MQKVTGKIHDYFIPIGLQTDEQVYRKARLFVNSTLLTSFFAVFFLLNTLVFQMPYHQGSMVFCSLAFFGIAFFLRWGVSLQICAHIYVAITAISTFWDGFFLGGLQSYDFTWIALSPIIAIMIGDKKIGWIWLSISVLAVIVMGAIQLSGYDFPLMINEKFYHLHGLNALLALVVVLFVIMLITENAFEESLKNLKLTQVKLVQSEKMASLGELTAGIAHEIQNPLNFVNNFAEVNSELIEELKEEQEKEVPDRELIEEILHDLADNMQKMVHHGKRADSIVKGMLMHSRSGSGEKEIVNVNALADEYMRLAYHGLRAKDNSFNATLERNFQSEVLLARMMPQDFGRVLLNIFNNAFYALMQRKKVESDTYQPTVWLSSTLSNGWVEIRVRDNGTGIPEVVRAKIFEPFFTTKPTGQGTGLGLSLSYDIINQGHDGSLEVESEPGAFTEFIIRIPQGKVN